MRSGSACLPALRQLLVAAGRAGLARGAGLAVAVRARRLVRACSLPPYTPTLHTSTTPHQPATAGRPPWCPRCRPPPLRGGAVGWQAPLHESHQNIWTGHPPCLCLILMPPALRFPSNSARPPARPLPLPPAPQGALVSTLSATLNFPAGNMSTSCSDESAASGQARRRRLTDVVGGAGMGARVVVAGARGSAISAAGMLLAGGWWCCSASTWRWAGGGGQRQLGLFRGRAGHPAQSWTLPPLPAPPRPHPTPTTHHPSLRAV